LAAHKHVVKKRDSDRVVVIKSNYYLDEPTAFYSGFISWRQLRTGIARKLLRRASDAQAAA
jgi:hypothetical protein